MAAKKPVQKVLPLLNNSASTVTQTVGIPPGYLVGAHWAFRVVVSVLSGTVGAWFTLAKDSTQPSLGVTPMENLICSDAVHSNLNASGLDSAVAMHSRNNVTGLWIPVPALIYLTTQTQANCTLTGYLCVLIIPI